MNGTTFKYAIIDEFDCVHEYTEGPGLLPSPTPFVKKCRELWGPGHYAKDLENRVFRTERKYLGTWKFISKTKVKEEKA